MIVEQTQRATGTNRVTVEVGEHLLAALQADIQEKDYRDGFIGQFWLLIERGEYGRPTVLTIVNNKLGLHWDFQHTKSFLRRRQRLECDLRIDGRGDGRENVVVRIVENVVGDFGNASL